MTNTQPAPTATESLTDWAERIGMTRDQLAAGVTLAAVMELLSQDPEVRDMFAANDREHFLLGCQAPAFQSKLGAALIQVRELATA